MNAHTRIREHILYIFLLLLIAIGQAQEVPAQPWCPVATDEAASEKFSVVYEARKVYFCCRGCRKDFLADPERYLVNLDGAVATNDSRQAATVPVASELALPLPDEHDARQRNSVLQFIGKLHPLVVHFPIAFIPLVLFMDLYTTCKKREPFASTRIILPLAALSALAAAGLGWVDAMHANYPEELQTTLFRHRWSGVLTAVITGAAAVMQHLSQSGGKCRDITYGVLLALACVLVGVTGHLGATLIYGVDYFAF